MKTAVRGLPRAALDHPDEESSPVVLVLDGEGLLALNYNLVPFSDPVWSERECDWETEIECWDDIEPLEEVLIAAEPVAPERYQDFIERGRVPFKPTAPPTSSFELTVMADTVGKLAENEITPSDAGRVMSALAAVQRSLLLTRDQSTSSGT